MKYVRGECLPDEPLPDERAPTRARRRAAIPLGIVLAVAMLGAPRGALHAQSAAALRVAAVPRAPSVEMQLAPPRTRRGLPPECRPWVGWGLGIGAAAGLAWGIDQVAHSSQLARPFVIAFSPVLVMLPTVAGGAIGGLTGYLGCAIRYAGSPSSS